MFQFVTVSVLFDDVRVLFVSNEFNQPVKRPYAKHLLKVINDIQVRMQRIV